MEHFFAPNFVVYRVDATTDLWQTHDPQVFVLQINDTVGTIHKFTGKAILSCVGVVVGAGELEELRIRIVWPKRVGWDDHLLFPRRNLA